MGLRLCYTRTSQVGWNPIWRKSVPDSYSGYETRLLSTWSPCNLIPIQCPMPSAQEGCATLYRPVRRSPSSYGVYRSCHYSSPTRHDSSLRCRLQRLLGMTSACIADYLDYSADRRSRPIPRWVPQPPPLLSRLIRGPLPHPFGVGAMERRFGLFGGPFL
jgi:hypothetical protein